MRWTLGNWKKKEDFQTMLDDRRKKLQRIQPEASLTREQLTEALKGLRLKAKEVVAYVRICDHFGKEIIGAGFCTTAAKKAYYKFKKPYKVPADELDGLTRIFETKEDTERVLRILAQDSHLKYGINEILWHHILWDDSKTLVKAIIYYTTMGVRYYHQLNPPIRPQKTASEK